LICLDLANTFPRYPLAVALRCPPLDQTAHADDQTNDLALVAMNFVNSAERLAVQPFDFLVAQVR
jgi:hypothetical protein